MMLFSVPATAVTFLAIAADTTLLVAIFSAETDNSPSDWIENLLSTTFPFASLMTILSPSAEVSLSSLPEMSTRNPASEYVSAFLVFGSMRI